MQILPFRAILDVLFDYFLTLQILTRDNVLKYNCLHDL